MATRPTITTDSGQRISGDDPNYDRFKAGITKTSSSAALDSARSSTSSIDRTVVPRVSLESATAQAEQAFSGVVSPMSLEEIRTREKEAQDLALQAANSTYDPQKQREQQVGGAQVSTAEGVVGQRQGFNVSTAELAFVADVQTKVEDRIKSVENAKATYIAQGNMAAADRADQQIQQLNEFNTQMTIAKANYALQIMAGNRDEARLGLEKDKFALEEANFKRQGEQFDKQLAISIAGLTGEYEGSPTFAAKQAEIQNSIATANLTGYYEGKETLAAVAQRVQLDLAKKGYELNVKQLEETIRSNRAQESIARSRGGGGGSTETTPSSYTDAAIARLRNLRDSGKLTDANYDAEVRNLAAQQGIDVSTPDAYGAFKSGINKTLEGPQTAREAVSTFFGETPKSEIKETIQTKIVNDYNNAKSKFIAEGRNEQEASQEATKFVQRTGNYSGIDQRKYLPGYKKSPLGL